MSLLLKISGLTSFILFLLNPLMILSVFIILIGLSDVTIAETNIEKCNRIIYETHSVKSDNKKLNKQHQKFAMCIANRSSMIFVETKCECSSPKQMLLCIDQYATKKSVSQMDLLNAIASDCRKNIHESKVDQT
tara:strand:+ start:332 stop:733 length:402 start_codon:yes stop_codon:yes gene_type:complete